MNTTESQIEKDLIEKLGDLKYTYRPDIRDRAALEANFRQHFEALNRVHLTDSEFHRLLDSIITPDVFTAAKHLREKNSFERDDGTPLYYTLVNIRDWCKNNFEVINQLRISTDYSHHRFDVILLINGVPVVQIELKTLQISPRKAMQQIVDYKHDPGNGYTITHAIEDRNVLRFHVDYYKPEGKAQPKQGEPLAKRAIVEAILSKHDAATAGRKFNAVLATASHARMEQQIAPLFLDYDQRRKADEVRAADEQDEAELKALESKIKDRKGAGS